MNSQRRNRPVSVEDIALYLAKGCLVHPPLYDQYLDDLKEMERREKVSLTPSCIFALYHRNLYRKISKAA